MGSTWIFVLQGPRVASDATVDRPIGRRRGQQELVELTMRNQSDINSNHTVSLHCQARSHVLQTPLQRRNLLILDCICSVYCCREAF